MLLIQRAAVLSWSHNRLLSLVASGVILKLESGLSCFYSTTFPSSFCPAAISNFFQMPAVFICSTNALYPGADGSVTLLPPALFGLVLF